MAISVKEFGQYKGKPVRQFTLRSETGVEVDIIEYGVVVRDWRVPVAGGARSVVLGFEDFDSYVEHSPYFGTVAGRVANRIGGAEFTIGDKSYKVPANQFSNSLHGGPDGLAKQIWEGTADGSRNAVVFRHHSPDGHMGYPGNLDATATYSLTGNRLRLEFTATLDQVSPLSLVQHQYFNLGTGPDILDHSYQIEAGAYTELNEELIPTGNILEVAGTDRNFRTPRTLLDTLGAPIAYDFNLVLDQGRELSKPIATVVGPDKALTLKLWTDRPGVQFYNSVYTRVKVPGLGGKQYGHFSGFCLEDQSYPDAVHHPHFPSVWYSPERPYSHWSEIEIA